MRKIIAFFLPIVMLLALAACGAEPSQRPETQRNTPANTWTCSCGKLNDDAFCCGCGSKKPKDPAPTTDSQPEIDSGDDDPQIEVDPLEFKKTATIDETVLVDENGVKITAKELVYGNYAVELTLIIENNSDKDLSFIANSIGYSCNSINGYMVPEG